MITSQNTLIKRKSVTLNCVFSRWPHWNCTEKNKHSTMTFQVFRQCYFFCFQFGFHFRPFQSMAAPRRPPTWSRKSNLPFQDSSNRKHHCESIRSLTLNNIFKSLQIWNVGLLCSVILKLFDDILKTLLITHISINIWLENVQTPPY
jgi:hypothetical protein